MASYSPDRSTCNRTSPDEDSKIKTVKKPLRGDLSILVQKKNIKKQIANPLNTLGNLMENSLYPNNLQLATMNQITSGGLVFDISGAPNECVTI
jgi:hypothetical protein